MCLLPPSGISGSRMSADYRILGFFGHISFNSSPCHLIHTKWLFQVLSEVLTKMWRVCWDSPPSTNHGTICSVLSFSKLVFGGPGTLGRPYQPTYNPGALNRNLQPHVIPAPWNTLYLYPALLQWSVWELCTPLTVPYVYEAYFSYFNQKMIKKIDF